MALGRSQKQDRLETRPITFGRYLAGFRALGARLVEVQEGIVEMVPYTVEDAPEDRLLDFVDVFLPDAPRFDGEESLRDLAKALWEQVQVHCLKARLRQKERGELLEAYYGVFLPDGDGREPPPEIGIAGMDGPTFAAMQDLPFGAVLHWMYARGVQVEKEKLDREQQKRMRNG